MTTQQPKPRIWGEWTAQYFGSGTTIVCQRFGAGKPHLYIYADASADESRYMRERFSMCEQIRDYMNGTGPRPVWLDDFMRTSETYLDSLAGASITAIGPMVDASPPNLDWRQDESDQARYDRARLIDTLVMGRSEP